MTYNVDMDNKAKGIYLIDFQTTKYKVEKTIIIN
jgi:hypothetical protein